ncbi:hypothetical protein VM1G_10592 [Cytospora mali]|uniref:Zn(2)-C6 fungal-type domain-containing protein n=1 Tax=Cytospora mali TaxID=578113 RepID=A0A194VIN6_CYTMA|nr:hypothetical protein VM1G_10592 [Valsa mali]
MSDEEVETASIACEACRQKKCKCDRRMPTCTQCRSSPAKCHYPEKNRRGIPAGYVNTLEKRLAETERALFFALAEIHAGVVARDDYESPALRQTMGESVLSSPTPITQQDKAKLMASWARTPLADREQVQKWFEANRGKAALPTRGGSDADLAKRRLDAVITPATPANSSAVASNRSGQPVTRPHRQSQAVTDSSGSSVPEADQRSTQNSWAESHPNIPSLNPGSEEDRPSAWNVSQASKARSFARDNTNLYF